MRWVSLGPPNMWVIESHKKNFGSIQKGPSSKAAATWTDGAYDGVREYGQGARTPVAAFFNTPNAP